MDKKALYIGVYDFPYGISLCEFIDEKFVTTKIAGRLATELAGENKANELIERQIRSLLLYLDYKRSGFLPICSEYYTDDVDISDEDLLSLIIQDLVFLKSYDDIIICEDGAFTYLKVQDIKELFN